MPELTLHINAERMPAGDALASLSDECTQLCVQQLGATLENVHIQFVASRPGRGHPACARLMYRLAPQRTAAVMAGFMQQLDRVIQRHAGLTARIRCVGHAPDALHARN